ncbi:MAG: hypothetical protein HQL30_12965, partial [Candidatus Omnitrophica bacterium]|nr:hypothetical protein [Candidatus Omnitrophota bacterium]
RAPFDKVPFTGRKIVDTPLREGAQAGLYLSEYEMLEWVSLLAKLGVVVNTEMFLYLIRDINRYKVVRDFMADEGFLSPGILGFGRATPSDIARFKKLGAKKTYILAAVTDRHIFRKLQNQRERSGIGLPPRKWAMNLNLDSIRLAIEQGAGEIHLVVEDITRADMFGFVIPFLIQAMAISREADVPLYLEIADTLGVGEASSQAQLPRGIPAILHTVREYAGIPPQFIRGHCHHGIGMPKETMLANARAFWEYGGSILDVSLGGIGDQEGILSMRDALIMLEELEPGSTNPAMLSQVDDFFADKQGRPRGFKAGDSVIPVASAIHADGTNKDPYMYRHTDYETVLGRTEKFVINLYSGRAGVRAWIMENLNYAPDSDLVDRVYARVIDQYERGRESDMTDEEMAELITLCKDTATASLRESADALNVAARECGLNAFISGFNGASQGIKSVSKLHLCLPIDVFRNSADSVFTLQSALLKQGEQAGPVQLYLMITGVEDEDDVKILENLKNNVNIRDEIGLSGSLNIDMMPEKDIAARARLMGRTEIDTKLRVGIIKDLYLEILRTAELPSGEFMAIATDAVSSREALKEKTELSEILQENLSIRVLSKPANAGYMFSMTQILADWLRAIQNETGSSIKILDLPEATVMINKLNNSILALRKALIAA